MGRDETKECVLKAGRKHNESWNEHVLALRALVECLDGWHGSITNTRKQRCMECNANNMLITVFPPGCVTQGSS